MRCFREPAAYECFLLIREKKAWQLALLTTTEERNNSSISLNALTLKIQSIIENLVNYSIVYKGISAHSVVLTHH